MGEQDAKADLGCSDCQARQQQGENIACPMCVMTADLGCADCQARQKQGENIACPMGEQVENVVLKAGGDLDAHGCKHSAGEEYCSTTKKCIRPWEEKCEELGCADCQARQKQGENIACPMCAMTI